MNILLINTAYSGGGAEKVFRQLFHGMSERGHNTFGVVGYNKEDIDNDKITILYHGFPKRIFNRIITNNHDNASISIDYSYKKIVKIIKKNNIDVLHINNIHGNYLGIKDIEKLSRIVPIVWTIHDFWIFTGHCAYPKDCEKWKKDCSICPNLNENIPLKKDISHKLLKEKKSYFRKNNIEFVTPSYWLSEQFQKSYLKNEKLTMIYNGVDTEKWFFKDKNKTRQKYGINENQNIICFVAANVDEPRKGIKFLISSLNIIKNPQSYTIIIAGDVSNEILNQIPEQFRVISFGFISNEKKMNEFFSLADIFVNPSTADIFGLVNIEALISGTPIIAFNTCAINEIVDNSVGWVVECENIKKLAECIENAFSDKKILNKMSLNCIEYVKHKFSLSDNLSQYEMLYKKAIKKHRKQ